MSYDHSPYEKTHPVRREQSANIAIGRIIDVNISKRTCTVGTFSGNGSIFDQFIEECQWLCPDVNPEGDEMGAIPRKGSYGIVFFVDGQAFIGNYFKPLGNKGTTLRGNEAATLNEGDKIISTLAGNRLTVKRSGLIELFVSDSLRRLMLPTAGQIIDQCSSYNFKCDGGFHDWRADKLLNTLWKSEYYSHVSRAFVIEEKRGYVTGSVLFRQTIGPGVPGIPGSKLPVYTKNIEVTGKTTTTVSPPLAEGSPAGYKSTINPDGSVEVLAGAAQTVKATVGADGATELNINKLCKINISPTGALSLDINSLFQLSISETGDLDVAGPVGMASINKTGDININNSLASMAIKASGIVEVKNTGVTLTFNAAGGVDIAAKGMVNIEGVGPMNIKTKGQIMIDGGTGASDFVLTNPTTLSPFTGAPLVPFSTTVMVSK